MNDTFTIKEITESEEKYLHTRKILQKLPDWFGNPQAIEEYAESVRELPYFAAHDGEECIGFFAVKVHYEHTGDIYVCGVLPEYHGRGVGTKLYKTAEEYLRQMNCKYVIVKTLSEQAEFEPYERTRAFYRSVGFEPLITLTEMWDEENPCLIMLKNLK